MAFLPRRNSARPAHRPNQAATGRASADYGNLHFQGGGSKHCPQDHLIHSKTGKHVFTSDGKTETDHRVINQISAPCEETMNQMNALDTVIQRLMRTNQVSGKLNKTARGLLNTSPRFTSDIAQT